MNHKLFLLTLGFAFLFFTWCSQTPIKIPESIESGNFSTAIPMMTGREEIREWRLNTSTVISGIYHPILISWDTLTYSWIFSLSLPKELDSREYVSRNDVISKTMSEWMGFTNDRKQQAASFHIRKLVRPQSASSVKELCKQEYMDGLVSQSERRKDIQWRMVYTSYAVVNIAALDVKPRRVEELQFCFVDSGMLYNFSLSNYSKAYMESRVDSLVFN